MSLFDDLKGQALQALEGSTQSMLKQAVSNAVPGGIGGLLTALQNNGMSEQVESWLSSEATNLPINADQLEAALGNEHLQQIASSLGMSTDQIREAIAEHLPALAASHLPSAVAPSE